MGTGHSNNRKLTEACDVASSWRPVVGKHGWWGGKLRRAVGISPSRGTQGQAFLTPLWLFEGRSQDYRETLLAAWRAATEDGPTGG